MEIDAGQVGWEGRRTGSTLKCGGFVAELDGACASRVFEDVVLTLLICVNVFVCQWHVLTVQIVCTILVSPC